MHRINRDDLEIEISIAIQLALQKLGRLLKAKRLPHESQELARALAKVAVERIDGESRMVIAADKVGNHGNHGITHGKWGVDEPDPTQ